MEVPAAAEFLKNTALEASITLSESQIAKFLIYLAELKSWNKKINLTALDTDREIILKHFVDSLIPLRTIPPGVRIFDLGSGAGFPGIPLKIAEPSLTVVLLEARRKKVHFLKHVIRKLGLEGIRAEEVFLNEKAMGYGAFSDKADVVISRAFSDLPKFLSLAGSLLRPGGRAVAMKGIRAREEVEKLSAGGIKDRFASPEIIEARLPCSNTVRYLLIFQKCL